MQTVDPENRPAVRSSKADRMRLIQGFETTGSFACHANMIVHGSKADQPEEMRIDNYINSRRRDQSIYFHIYHIKIFNQTEKN